MKKFIALVLIAVASIGISNAQYKDTEYLYDKAPSRKNLVLPTVDGLNCYTADLHIHTFFSDGEISPAERVREAWADGLDIIAITDHIETRRQEREMLKFLKGYSPDKKGFEPINTRCSRGVPADERGIVSDLNLSSKLAAKEAKLYPELTVIKGAEISREPVHIGHYCALFTKDNNTLYSTDDAQTIRNARAQGAIITHNHPGWERKTTNYTEFEKKIYAEGLIDGIEVANGAWFYPKMVERAIDKKLYMVSASDIHTAANARYGNKSFYREMTLIFAKNKSEKAIREALLSQKTLAYHAGNIVGKASLLEKFFKASVSASYIGVNKKSHLVRLTNNTSFAYTLTINGKPVTLAAFQSATCSVKDLKFKVEVNNMIHTDYNHLVVDMNVKK